MLTLPIPSRAAAIALCLAFAPFAAPVVAQEPGLAALSADHPGMLASWMQSRPVYSSGRAEIGAEPLQTRPDDWPIVARVEDLVISDDHRLVGVVAEVGGVLGVGGHQVMLPPDALLPMRIGAESFFVTSLSKAELDALPEFDTTFVLH